MTELIRNWLMGITCASMVMAVAEVLVPEGSIRRICRLAGGLMLLLAAINPVLNLDEGALSRALTEYRIAAQDYGDVLVEKNNLLYKTIIEEETAAYILDKAQQLGLDCQVRVTCHMEGGVWLPWSVQVTGIAPSASLTRAVEEGLGVAGERICYGGGE